MKKIILGICLFLLILTPISKATPIFGDGTSPRDTIWISFNSFDTLAFFADCDTFFVRRYWHGVLVDSTFSLGTANKIRTGFYSLPKKAWDGSHYGQYDVEIEWHISAKGFKRNFNYIVVQGGMDSTNVELASSQTFDNTGTWTGNITGNLSGAVGSVTGAVGSVTGNVDGSVASVTAEVSADMTKISGDGTAADNLETMLDGTGGQILSLRGLHIRGTAGSDTALIAIGYGGGYGAFFYGGVTNGHGFVVKGQGIGNGAYFLGGATSGSGLYVIGGGSGEGLYAKGGATGHGIQGQGGSGGANGIFLVGSGVGDGIRAFGGATGTGAQFGGGSTSGHGIHIQAQGGNSHGMLVEGYGSGHDIDGDIYGTITTATNVTNAVTLVDSSAGDISYIANTPADYKANVSALAVQTTVDSLLTALGYDADSSAHSFLRWLRDTTHAVHVTAIAVKAKTDNLPTDPADDSDIDGQLATIQTDLDDPSQYKATGFSTHEAKDIWVEIDTAGTIDTSDIGDWFINNTKGGAQDSITAVARVWVVDSTRKVYILDSLDQTITAETDTTLIKTVAENNPAIWTDQVGGTGTEQETLIVFDVSDTTTIDVLDITVYNASGGEVASGQTDVNGMKIFYLDPATYTFTLHKIGIVDKDTSLTITTDGTDSFYVEIYDVGAPPSGGKCRIYNWIYNLIGEADSTYVVRAENLNIPLRYQNALISPYKVETNPNDTGYFYLDLYKTSELTPDTSTYLLRILDPDGEDILYDSLDNTGIEFTVPDSTSWLFTW